MARHAYMIIAHSNWEQLSILLTLLDSKTMISARMRLL